MREIEFLQPEVLWAVPVVLLVLALWRMRRRKRFVAFSAVGWVKRLRHHPSAVRRMPAVLLLAAIGFIVAALMDPVVPFSEAEVKAQGLDVVLVLDLSSSMQEMMGGGVPPRSMTQVSFGTRAGPLERPKSRTRLDVTKEALKDLIGRRRDDRIGLVVFSDNPYLISPLTFDYTSLVQYVEMVDDQILRGEGMTAIGDGIALANFLLARQSTSDRRNKVIVVFTDGEHNFGRDPIEVLGEADAAGVKVYVIGVDIEEEVKNKPAVQRLIGTVREYGGQYFNADTVAQLRAANAAIDSLEKGMLTSRTFVRNTPVFDWLVIPAIVLIAAGITLRTVPYFAEYT